MPFRQLSRKVPFADLSLTCNACVNCSLTFSIRMGTTRGSSSSGSGRLANLVNAARSINIGPSIDESPHNGRQLLLVVFIAGAVLTVGVARRPYHL